MLAWLGFRSQNKMARGREVNLARSKISSSRTSARSVHLRALRPQLATFNIHRQQTPNKKDILILQYQPTNTQHQQKRDINREDTVCRRPSRSAISSQLQIKPQLNSPAPSNRKIT